MQNKQYIFKGKTYTTLSGLKSAQRAWIQKNLPELTAKLLSAPDGLKGAKIENYLPSGILLPEYMEQVETYIRAAFIARLYFRIENRINGDWTTRPDEGSKFATSHAGAELVNCGLWLTAEEKKALFDWAAEIGATNARARYHAKIAARQMEGTEAQPARRNNTPKRERKDRSAKNRAKVKGKKQRK